MEVMYGFSMAVMTKYCWIERHSIDWSYDVAVFYGSQQSKITMC